MNRFAVTLARRLLEGSEADADLEAKDLLMQVDTGPFETEFEFRDRVWRVQLYDDPRYVAEFGPSVAFSWRYAGDVRYPNWRTYPAYSAVTLFEEGHGVAARSLWQHDGTIHPANRGIMMQGNDSDSVLPREALTMALRWIASKAPQVGAMLRERERARARGDVVF